MTEVHVLFLGRVQGVGFRYTAQRLAHGLGLSGWVRNQPNGHVELVAEGERDVINRLLARIEHQFEGNIQEKQVSFQPSHNQYHDFRIVC
ncbi:MAG: acylphosphatase [Candidatus Omnitrophica bacterium]|nr:acylphosphatase [Candidatus Omnitrophota bacterium]